MGHQYLAGHVYRLGGRYKGNASSYKEIGSKLKRFLLESVRYLQEYLDRRGGDFVAWFELGDAVFGLSNITAAKICWAKSLQSIESAVQSGTGFGLAKMERRRGQLEERMGRGGEDVEMEGVDWALSLIHI